MQQKKVRTAGRRRLEVIGLGEGVWPMKAISLALKHPKHNFTSVEWHPRHDPHFEAHTPKRSQYGSLLYMRGKTQKPANLMFKHGADAVEYLKTLRPASVDHIYAHFLFQHLSLARRAALFTEIFRTLKPGSRLTFVDGVHYQTQFPLELKKAGFSVWMKRLDSVELAKLNTPNSIYNARDHIQRLKEKKILKSAPLSIFIQVAREKKSLVRSADELIEEDIRRNRQKILRGIREREGEPLSDEALALTGRVRENIRDLDSEKPFIVIKARKPRE